MPSRECLQGRRSRFLDAIDGPVLLMAGGWMSRNYPANPVPYRADSTFLYFFDAPEPDAAAWFDPDDRSVVLFLNARTPEDALWHGPVPSFEAVQDAQGVDRVEDVAALESRITELAKGRSIRSLAVPDHRATARAARITGESLDFYSESAIGNPALVLTIAALRKRKDDEEIAEMRRTAGITHEAHLAAMNHTRPGVLEEELAGRVEGAFARHGCVPAYGTILSVRGEVLHNHAHDQVCQDGDIVLLDAGAEAATGYCSDVTRCWPVSGTFSPEGAEVYDIVLAAEKAAIDLVAPGVRYRDVHFGAARVVADGLHQMGVLRCDADAALETGAQTLFFPHGVGHLIGLDVHDMEGFGDQVHYPGDRERSDRFGDAYLRMDLDLEAGMTFTIEPGLYFVPAILRSSEFRDRFAEQVDFDRAEHFLSMNDGRGFGGIRIEDDILATAAGAEVLTASVPKERADVEAQVGTAR